MADKARFGCNDARSIARTDARTHTGSEKKVSTSSSSLQVRSAQETLVKIIMHVKAIKANLSHMPLCSRCGNDPCGNDILLSIFLILFLWTTLYTCSVSYFQRVHQCNITRILNTLTIHNLTRLTPFGNERVKTYENKFRTLLSWCERL